MGHHRGYHLDLAALLCLTLRFKMTWVPPNIAETCPAQTQLSACSPFAYAFLTLVMKLYGDSIDRRIQEQHPPKPAMDQETYDFIVVGAGAAGSVVTNRLSAVEDFKVLLLEAGPEEPDVTSVPSLSTTLLNSNIDWQYKTMPSRHACLAFPNQQCAWPRGKVMGGSSSINSMAYVRGHRLDFDDWAAAGNPGWSYSDVLPFFKKSERNLNIADLNPAYHGDSGEQAVSQFPHLDKPALMLTNAFVEIGLPLLDFNGCSQLGTMQSQAFADEGERASANREFIRPIRYKRRNLTVRPESEVVKILFDDNKKAIGVQYKKNGKLLTAFASKEIILSAGAINSPKLLMLSGIGPEKHLGDLNIPVIQNLAVGENLHDHVTFNGLVVALPEKTATTVSRRETLQDITYYKRLLIKRGPLSGNGPVCSVAFYKTDPKLPAPDIQVQVNALSWKEYIREPSVYDGLAIFPTAYYDAVGPRVMNVVPYSRGRLLLNSSDPNGHPLLYAGYLDDPRDLSVLIKGVRILLALEDTDAFKSRGAVFVKKPLSACRNFIWGTDAYWECVARSYTSSTHHAAGTCKMGPKSDPKAVVDPRLKVYGVEGLRVIDASIMPKLIRGNTNAPSMMIGERGVAFVLEDWQQNKKDR